MSIKTLLDQIGTTREIAAACNVKPIAVYRWGQSGSIPSKHLSGVLSVARQNGVAVTADDLCAALANDVGGAPATIQAGKAQ